MYIYKSVCIYSYYNFTGGVDYSSGPYNVTFTAGNTIEPFDILINDDGVLERTETFTLVISQFTSSFTVGTRNEATVHIMNTNSKLLVCSFLYMYSYMCPLNKFRKGMHT